MQKHIALLRGVNVGGKNKMPMGELKAMFERDGFADVSTCIQSGNVIFYLPTDGTGGAGEANRRADRSALRVCRAGMRRPRARACRGDGPCARMVEHRAKHNAIFVIPPATPEDIYAAVGQLKPEYEKAAHYGRVIFWSAPVKTFSRTRLSRVVGTAGYDCITIRNANTALKLRQLAE